jgi:hypothetical protein
MGAVLRFAVNDHVLKGAGLLPGWLTGASACLMVMMLMGGGLCGQAAFFPFRGTDVQMNVLFRGHLELFSTR